MSLFKRKGSSAATRVSGEGTIVRAKKDEEQGQTGEAGASGQDDTFSLEDLTSDISSITKALEESLREEQGSGGCWCG
jgi:hypothetical protein